MAQSSQSRQQPEAERLQQLGQLQQTLIFLQQALPIFRELGNRSGEARTLNTIGNVYRNIGQPQEALISLQQALQIFREVREIDDFPEGRLSQRYGEASSLISMVVTGLWSPPDSQTVDLMVKFYEKMLQQNLRPAEALRAAQLEMWRSRNWSPFNWAAFTLQGDWR